MGNTIWTTVNIDTLSALNDGNLTPLLDMMTAGDVPHECIVELLRDMVDPKGHSQLKVVVQRRHASRPRKDELYSLQIHQEVLKAAQGGKIEAGVAAVMAARKMSRSQVFVHYNIWAKALARVNAESD